jgi:hypothetical protein
MIHITVTVLLYTKIPKKSSPFYNFTVRNHRTKKRNDRRKPITSFMIISSLRKEAEQPDERA